VPQLSAFSMLRDELKDAAGARLPTDRLAHFRQRLAALDEREARRAVPPSRGANAQLWRGIPWQLVAVVLAFLPTVAVLAGGFPGVGVVLAGLLLPLVSYLLALAVARASVAAAGARSQLHSHQRAEITELLEQAARSSRQRVAGLGDRVARALHILRKQQAERPE
jgi:hypothetical protein